uniref:Restriction endonuclease type IV Mrr domain-containing protein n=1 Tax=Rhodopseudomonas palustris (strain DX-1) TaxID=652103 RepID=E6VP07_RHOPX
MSIARTVRPIHFEDFDGAEFERLVFAYHLCDGWTDLAWYGQTGSDHGRDIIGTEIHDNRPNQRTVIQCVNRGSLTQAKAEADMTAAVGAPSGRPDAFKFVCRSNVSAQRRDAVAKAAAALGVYRVTIWSGTEFEEQLRLRAEFLLKRLVDGVPFPDAEADLRRFVDQFPDIDDDQALSMMALVFDRPAFRTPFQQESNLPAFLQAIEDTIGALNTGIWKTRDGIEIRRLPSLHHLRSENARTIVQRTVRDLDQLRRTFKTMLSDGAIRHCGCGDANCPVFMMTDDAAYELDRARTRVLHSFGRAYPAHGIIIE